MNNNIIMAIAEEISALIPDCCGVTLGGSRMNGLEDEKSDVEMYFYTHQGAPSVDSITSSLTLIPVEYNNSKIK